MSDEQDSVAPSSSDRLAEAAAWRVALWEGGDEHVADFEDWLQADERNRSAFAEVQGGWDFFSDHATSPEVLEARQQALQWARRGQQRSGRWAPRMPLRHLAAGIAVLVLAGFGTFYVLRPPPVDVMETAAGERRSIRLADGTLLSLDAESRVRVAIGADARTIELERGQARFQVTHDASRRFSVHTAGAQVVATGTDFNVSRDGDRTVVSLLHGGVDVLADRSTEGADRSEPALLARLRPGQQLTTVVRQGEVVRSAVISFDERQVLSWESGKIILDDESLGSAIVRINRGADVPIVLEPGLEDMRVSGLFNAGDTAAFSKTLQILYPELIARRNDGRIEIGRASN